MGDIYFEMGEIEKAATKYEEASTVKPDFGIEWKNAYIYALKEKYQKALDWVEHFIKNSRSPGRKGEGLFWKAYFHMWTGRFEQTLNEFRKLEVLAEELGNIYIKFAVQTTMGWVYYELKEYEKARNLFKSAFTLRKQFKPKLTRNWKAHHNNELGLIELKEGKINAAKDRFFRTEPVSEQCYFFYKIFYAELLFAQDSLDKSMTIWVNKSKFETTEVDMDVFGTYNVPFLKDLLPRIFLKKGDLDNAIAEYERLIVFDPISTNRFLIHPKYHYQLAKLYEQKGVKEKAIKEYKKFLELWKDADEDLPELIDAKVRLKNLRTGK